MTTRTVRIAVLGDRNPGYSTHRDLDAALTLLPADIEAAWLPTDKVRPGQLTGQVDGVWLAPAGIAAAAHAEADPQAEQPTPRTPGSSCRGTRSSWPPCSSPRSAVPSPGGCTRC